MILIESFLFQLSKSKFKSKNQMQNVHVQYFRPDSFEKR